jgi:hypothetical protein
MIPPLLIPAPVVPGAPLLAERWNALLGVLAVLRPNLKIDPPRGEPPHPWKVTVSTNPEDATRLRITLLPGLVNDQSATIVWKAEKDPRGPLPAEASAAWKAARDAKPQDAFLQQYYDRPLYEKEPPFLEIGEDPTAKGSDWQEMPAGRVPRDLREAAPDGAKFYVAGVVLAAFPFNVLMTVPLPRRFRVYVGRANPAAVRAARAGELLQLARIWQVRDAQGQRVDLRVGQDVFWHVGCMAVEPQLQEIPGMTLPPIGLPLVDMFAMGVQAGINAVTGLVNGFLASMESTLESTEFWTAP